MEVQQKVALRHLGHTDLQISALGLGCWQFGGNYWTKLKQKDIDEIVKICLSGGINWFDTAEVYGKGSSEMALSESLFNINVNEEDALIATKWWPLFRRANSIPKTIDQRIKALNGRRIDLYQVHQPFSFSSVRDQMKAMAELIRINKIRYVGVSNFSAKKMADADDTLKKQGYFLASNQVKYSLLDRRIETNGVLDTAKERGITVIAYSPLEQGILSGKFHKNPEIIKNMTGPRKHSKLLKPAGLEKTKPLIDLLEKMAAKYEVSSSQIALNWLIHFHGDTVVAIPGATKPHHAKENIGALNFTLTQEDMDEINIVSKTIAKL
ncbi:aldo/keto reductase [Litchfieldia alkalitelluris]|uniref:aldo/keto reductase n=1 Tax=Litchfieldia alkalitelluris TaxID=304268 RepID=UPI0009982BD9|nr:aldo/keto reductase [Litchfieldia alkalitelluris]